MKVFLTIIAVIFAVLQIILFFKLWGMTNDVKDIKRFINRKSNKKDNVNPVTINSKNQILIGSHVVEIKTSKQMRVMLVENKDGATRYVCSNNNGITNLTFNRDEIELFSVYKNNKK